MGLTACGSGDSKAMDAWAVSLCSGVQGPVQQANTALADTGTVKNAEAPKDLQTRLAADFGTLATANTEIAQAVQKAGAPKVDNGAQTQADAVTELNQAAGGYTKVQQTVQQLPAGDQAKFADGLKGVSDQVQRLSGLSTSALQSLQTGALGVALAKQPGCKSVNGAASATAAPSGSGGASAPSSGSAAPTPGSSARPTATATATGKATGAAKPTATASAH
jgi:hypothetical protein